ncbi:MAG TPA: hypothetical protein VKR78_02430 [Acidimicrobiales bacterium]|nr:hypothetical protein [Acidimicrobiales bacterium]
MSERPQLRDLVQVPTGATPLPASDVAGEALTGSPRTVSLTSPGRWTLLFFLGSHCDGCLPFWPAAGTPVSCGLEPGDAVAVVTRGPEVERRSELLALFAGDPRGLVMSEEAWRAYRVHGAPFFVLVDGVEVITEGVAWSVEQVAADVRRVRHRPADPREADGHPRVRR